MFELRANGKWQMEHMGRLSLNFLDQIAQSVENTLLLLLVRLSGDSRGTSLGEDTSVLILAGDKAVRKRKQHMEAITRLTPDS